MMMATTAMACPIIQMINCRLPSNSSSWSKLCAGSAIAPKMAISTAPPQTRTVPASDHRVNASPRMRVAQIELKTNPDCLMLIAIFFTMRLGAYCLKC